MHIVAKAIAYRTEKHLCSLPRTSALRSFWFTMALIRCFVVSKAVLLLLMSVDTTNHPFRFLSQISDMSAFQVRMWETFPDQAGLGDDLYFLSVNFWLVGNAKGIFLLLPLWGREWIYGWWVDEWRSAWLSRHTIRMIGQRSNRTNKWNGGMDGRHWQPAGWLMAFSWKRVFPSCY